MIQHSFRTGEVHRVDTAQAAHWRKPANCPAPIQAGPHLKRRQIDRNRWADTQLDAGAPIHLGGAPSGKMRRIAAWMGLDTPAALLGVAGIACIIGLCFWVGGAAW